MRKQVEQVKEFDRVFETQNQTLDQKIEYFLEENDEMWNAMQLYIHAKEKNNPEKAKQKAVKEMLDALVDMKYVLIGIAIKENVILEEEDESKYTDLGYLSKWESDEVRRAYEDIEEDVKEYNFIRVNNTIDYLLHQLGLIKFYESAFDEIHASNMSKLDADGKVIRDEKTNKILKSDRYFKPNLYKILGY